ncbi:MAG: WecB/TagA/CpsF family glycosyltransferase [Butyrivibrio sp.]|nr:WecB/TagA/CpsF family glycosyltransferase [Butyrivibrio sp.]
MLLINADKDIESAKELLEETEKREIRTYLALGVNDYNVRSGIVTDIENYAAIPAAVRSERFELFGIRYAIARTEEAVFHVIKHLKELSGKYICFSNAHTSVMGRENPEYRDVLNNSAFTFADGSPIAKLQQTEGYIGAERVAGPDFMEHMFRNTTDGSVSHFFYGSTEETIEKLRNNLIAKYPGINIAGMYSPPFRPLSEEEDAADVEMINSSGADIVWIGLGAPKQEKWMLAHKDKIKGVMMGVGAGFDFHGGTIKRAPVWVRKIGLEWFFRLFQDPERLFKRYFVTNTKFLYYLMTDFKRK